jgi:hypothetical protein
MSDQFSMSDELAKLAQLRDSGALSEAEFEDRKRAVTKALRRLLQLGELQPPLAEFELTDEPAKLAQLRDAGDLTTAEFEEQKAAATLRTRPAPRPTTSGRPVDRNARPNPSVQAAAASSRLGRATARTNSPAPHADRRLLRKCPACGHDVSRAAPACPGCGHPFIAAPTPGTTECPFCHGEARQLQGVYGAEILALLVLVLLGLIPGLIYYFDITRYPYCARCRKRVKKPTWRT